MLICMLLGGSWLTGSLALNDWPTVQDLVYGNGGNLSGWLLDLNLGTPNGFNLFDGKNQAFYGSVLYSVMAKAAKGMYVILHFNILCELLNNQE